MSARKFSAPAFAALPCGEIFSSIHCSGSIGASAPRLANTTALALPGKLAEMLVIRLDLAGIAVSAGSACSSGKVGVSHVLKAMSLGAEVADGAIRVSLGPENTEKDIAAFVAAWKAIAGGAALAA